MTKERGIIILALLIYFLDYNLDVYHGKWEISQSLWKNAVFVGFHSILFLIITYLAIPKLLYKRPPILFFIVSLILIFAFGAFEEGVLEKWFYPNSRGKNDVDYTSMYHFLGEVLAPLLAIAGIKIAFDNFNKQEKIEQIEKDSLVNELKFLKSQIQPHILFNSLNNLYEYTLAKSDKAPELVLQLSNVLRYLLYETTEELIPLEKELHFVEEYISLQEVQLEGRGNIKFELQDEKGASELMIAPFILVPFIENCFKHSLNSKSQGIEIKVSIFVEATQLSLQTENNFDAKHHFKNEELLQSGVGLANVKKRLNLIYPNRYNLDINSTDERYHVLLALNLSHAAI